MNEKRIDRNFELVISEEVSRCLLCHDAPCSKACPAQTNPGKFIRSLRFENPKGAIETIKTNNVLGGICSKVCPSKAYCEGACSRVNLKTPVKIKMIQEYLMELDKALNVPILRERKHSDKKVAIVGSGPTGLAASVELIKEGYYVTVYERDEKLGGYLAYGIPSARLSQELVEYEINQIKDLGVKFKNNTNVENPQELLNNGFDAVIWACGLHKDKILNIETSINDLVNFKKGIFSAGDLVSKNKTVVYAIKSGKEIAKKVIEYLNSRCIVEDSHYLNKRKVENNV